MTFIDELIELPLNIKNQLAIKMGNKNDKK